MCQPAAAQAEGGVLSAFAKTQQRHGFQVSHNFGTDSHEARLLGTVKYHNGRNDFITNDESPLDVMTPLP